MASSLKIDERLLRYVLIVPAALYVLFSTLLTANVPLNDDFPLLDYIVDLRHATGLTDFLRLLVAPHYEHRIATSKLLGYLASLPPSGADFRVLLLASAGALIGALVVLGSMLRLKKRWELWLVLFGIVLQPQLQKLMVYTMGATLADFGMLFSVLYIALTLKRGSEHWALVPLLAAMLTTSAGFLLPVLGIPVLAARRRFRYALITLVIGALGWAIYLVGDVEYAETSLPFALQHPLLVARFFLGMLGAAVEIPFPRYSYRSTYTTIGLGIFLMIWIAWIGARAWHRRNQAKNEFTMTTVVVLGYCVLIISTIAIDRCFEYRENLLEASLDGRYRPYGLLALAVCIIDLLRGGIFNEQPSTRLRTLVVIASLAFCGWQYGASLADFRRAAEVREEAFLQWRRTGDAAALGPLRPNSRHPGEVLSKAAHFRVFRPSG